jgi:hypothetical protein
LETTSGPDGGPYGAVSRIAAGAGVKTHATRFVSTYSRARPGAGNGTVVSGTTVGSTESSSFETMRPKFWRALAWTPFAVVVDVSKRSSWISWTRQRPVRGRRDPELVTSCVVMVGQCQVSIVSSAVVSATRLRAAS